MAEGAYAYSGEKYVFRAGSYTGYNQWRDWLSDVVGVPRAGNGRPNEGPFVELIHFADNEGFIGPKTAAELVEDFAAWRPRAVAAAPAEDGAYYVEKYDAWAKAFAIAAKGGAVQFH